MNIADAVRSSSVREDRRVNKKGKFYDFTIRKKLIILLCVAGFVPVILLGVYISMNAHQTVVTNRKADMTNSLKLACVSVDNQMLVCEQMMRYFVYDQNVIDFLECSPEKKTERYGYYQKLREAVSALQYQNLSMSSVTIYSQGILQSFGTETQPLSLLMEEPWFQEKMKDGRWIIDSDAGEIVTLYKIPSYSGLESYAVVRAEMDTVFQSFLQLAAETYGVSVYREEEIWSAAGKECTGRSGEEIFSQEDNNSYICVEERIDNLDASVIFFQDKSNIPVISTNMLIRILIQIAVCLVIILLLGQKAADYISRPLELLTKEIQEVDENKIGTEIYSERKDEVGILIRSYNRMMKRIRDLIQENYEIRIARKEFEMIALRAQINPHFLYNSLSIINWKAIEAGEEEISNITLALSSFYRTTLNKGDSMISVRMVLENIQAYLKIQLSMHDDDFRVNYDVDEGTMDFLIPTLILQPFVENCLEHGLDVKEDPDHQIWIHIYQDRKAVYAEIRDNGVGMDEETLAHVLEYKAKGYGVKNVNDRMTLLYGEEYGIQIRSRQGEGTSILLTFPKDQEEKTKNADKS